MSYKDYDIPVFALYKKDEINNLIKVREHFSENNSILLQFFLILPFRICKMTMQKKNG